MSQGRDQEARGAFLSALRKIPEEQRLYTDGPGVDDNEEADCGYAPKGQGRFGERKSRKTARTALIPAYRPHGKALEAPFTFEGYTGAEAFRPWAERRPAPEWREGAALVLDRAGFHKARAVQQALRENSIPALFLPAYSPDLDPIEKIRAPLKRNIRRHKESMSLERATQHGFQKKGQPIEA